VVCESGKKVSKPLSKNKLKEATTVTISSMLRQATPKVVTVYPAKHWDGEGAPAGWLFVGPLETKAVYNAITAKHKSAASAKRRFYWTPEGLVRIGSKRATMKGWWTASTESFDQAVMELKSRGYWIKDAPTSAPAKEPSKPASPRWKGDLSLILTGLNHLAGVKLASRDRQFLDSVQQFALNRGYLTEKQVDILRGIMKKPDSLTVLRSKGYLKKAGFLREAI